MKISRLIRAITSPTLIIWILYGIIGALAPFAVFRLYLDLPKDVWDWPPEILKIALGVACFVWLVMVLLAEYRHVNANRYVINGKPLGRADYVDALERKLAKQKGEIASLNDKLYMIVNRRDNEKVSLDNLNEHMAELSSQLSGLETKNAEAAEEIEFWRNKGGVTAAADTYYMLCLDYKDEIATFGSLVAYVEHLHSIKQAVKQIDLGEGDGEG